MVEYVEIKDVNWAVVQDLLSNSAQLNKWTNFGPVSTYLEKQIHYMLGLPENLTVVCCSSGTAALNAVVGLYEYLEKKKLRWAVSSFGFYCTKQGLLVDAAVVDCNLSGFLDIEKLPLEYDGVVVTNVFATKSSLKEYKDFCNHNGKICIIDSATTFDSIEHGENEIISFHHTKPWGFGEGGCAIVSEKYRDILKTIINFGAISDYYSVTVSGNGKLSDVGAAFISQRLNDVPKIRSSYEQQYERIANIGIKAGFKILNNKLSFRGLAPNVPFISPCKIMDVSNSFVKLQKYYKPLQKTPIATDLFEHIVCFPCHRNLQILSDNDINNCFNELLNKH